MCGRVDRTYITKQKNRSDNEETTYGYLFKILSGGLATKGEIRFSEQQSQRGRETNIKGVEQGRQSKILNNK